MKIEKNNKYWLLLLLLSPQILYADVIITEIMYDVPGNDANSEWIEIYNNGTESIDIDEWKLFEGSTNHGITTSGATSTIGAGEYAVIADKVTSFLSDNPTFVGNLFDSSFSLHNVGETIALKNSALEIVDEVTYTSTVGGSGDGKTLQKIGEAWIAATSTPGYGHSDNEDGANLPAITIDSDVVEDTTWSADDGVYMLEGNINISASTTLIIEPGVIIKGKYGGSGMLTVYGTLNAVGLVEEPVIFTSLADDSWGGDSGQNGLTVGTAGDWSGIYVKEGGVINLDYVTVKYAGYLGLGPQAGIDVDGGEATITNSNIANNNFKGIHGRNGAAVRVENTLIGNNETGIFITDAILSVENSNITNNSNYGIQVYGNQLLTLTNNQFSGNNHTARIEAKVIFSHDGNTSNDTYSAFEMTGSVIGSRDWNSGDLPIVIQNSDAVWIEDEATLTIEPGSVVKFGAGAKVYVLGNLIIEGTEATPVQFVSLKDDSVAGDTNGDGTITTVSNADWGGVEFWAGSTGSISYAHIRHAGIFNNLSRAAIYNLGGDLQIEHATFTNNLQNDVFQNSGTTTITRSTFSSNSNTVITNVGTSILDARMNWWGSATGPNHVSNATGTGSYIEGSVMFEPWIRRDPSLPNPVIIVPGIMSTKLLKEGIIDGLIWPNFPNIALSITDDFLDILKMNDHGLPIDSDIIPGELLTQAASVDYWVGLFNLLQEDVIFIFPYDWRLDINTSVIKLKNNVDQIKLETGAENVDIVGHSMGGLLVKEFLRNYGGDSIDKFIDIASPHAGSPSAFKTIMYGDNIGISYIAGIFNLNTDRIKEISQNMPSVYQLLPSENYFDDSDPNYRYYVFNGINGNNRLSYDQTADYMKAEGRNGVLVDRAKELHQEIDNLNPADYGVETYNFVGCGTPTIGQFYILGKEGDKYIYNIKMINGDGTVPLRSAEAMQATQTYYVKNAQHAVMPSVSGVKELVANILTGGDLNISSYSNLALDANSCQIPNGKLVSFHSPIELHIYDDTGNHVGPDVNGDIENEIPGVTYEVIDDNKFAYLPDGVSYRVSGSATDIGTFDTRIQEIQDGEVVSTTLFTEIPLTLETQVNFDIGVVVPNIIYVDHDGDNIFETSREVSTTTNGFLESSGKAAVETIESDPVVNVSFGSSSSQSTRVRNMYEENIVATVIETQINKNTVAKTLGVKVITGSSLKAQKIEPRILNENQEDKYENSATVYKSFGIKIKSFFRSIWSWIINKI